MGRRTMDEQVRFYEDGNLFRACVQDKTGKDSIEVWDTGLVMKGDTVTLKGERYLVADRSLFVIRCEFSGDETLVTACKVVSL